MVLTAGDLKSELRPLSTEGEKTVRLVMTPGKRPEVTFTGVWTGKYIRAAMDSIAKAYRVARRSVILPTKQVAETQTQPEAEGRK